MGDVDDVDQREEERRDRKFKLLMAINKQIETELQVQKGLLPDLVKVPFTTWRRTLMQLAESYHWPDVLTDLDMQDPDPSVYASWDKLTQGKRRNAYLLITNSALGHSVESDLNNIKVLDARAAFRTIERFHIKKTPAGERLAIADFSGMSMQKSGQTIREYMNSVQTAAQTLGRIRGKEVDNSQIRVAILTGLLPDFKTKVTLLEETWAVDDLDDIEKLKQSLNDFAETNSYENLTAAGKLTGKDKTYNVHAKRKPHHGHSNAKSSGRKTTIWVAEDGTKMWYEHPWIGGDRACQRHAHGKCPYGDKCRFQHGEDCLGVCEHRQLCDRGPYMALRRVNMGFALCSIVAE